MLRFLVVSFALALLYIYLFMPNVWMSLMAVDGFLDAHESGLTMVAARNPFRENAPPISMAKLIMLRHKMNQQQNRKRPSAHPRQNPRNFTPIYPPLATYGRQKQASKWPIRFSRAAGRQNH